MNPDSTVTRRADGASTGERHRGRRLYAVVCLAALLVAACASTPAPESPLTQHTLSGAEAAPALRAAGHRPSWSLLLVPGGSLSFVHGADGSTARGSAPTPQVQVPSGFRVYETRLDGRSWSAEWRPYRCVDPVSGQEFPNVVEVRFDGQRYLGCGGPIARQTSR